MLSPIDELQHIDYLDRAAHGHLLHEGQQVQTLAMREESCRGGVEAVGLPGGTKCGGPYDPNKYQELGRNTADIHPPTYYLLTGPVARVLVASGLWSDFVDAGRALGGVWLAAGLWFLALSLRRLGASRALTGVAVLSLAVSPLVIRATSIVSNDATTLLSGSLLLYVCIRHRQGDRALGPLLVSSAIAASLRPTGILAVIAAAGVLLLAAPLHDGAADEAPAEPPRAAAPGFATLRGWLTWSRARAPVLMLVTAFVAQEAWLAIRGALAVHSPVPNLIAERQHVTSLAMGQVTGSVHAFLPLLGDDLATNTGTEHVHELLVTLLSWALVAAAAAVFMTARRAETLPTLGGVAITSLVVGGPFLVITTFLSQSAYFDIPQRYGVALMPFVVAAAVSGSNTLTRRLLFGLFVSSAVLGWYILLTTWTI
ncbi:MAG TPA: hypothetical protein VHE83_13095 [Mycobacteriales bacterium]|nr:hypothetical protein [Mycobacteriales bacterium]